MSPSPRPFPRRGQRSPARASLAEAAAGPECPGCGRPRGLRVFGSSAIEVVREHCAEHGPAPVERLCLGCLQRAVDHLHDEVYLPRPGDEEPGLERPEGRLEALPVLARAGGDPAWTGRGVTVAFLDSGFYPGPDLCEPKNRILAHAATGGEALQETRFGARMEGWPEEQPPPSTSWHGSMTSTVALGNGLLSGGMYRGLASEARAVLVKVSGPKGRIGDRHIAAGLRYVLGAWQRYDIRVVSISCGGDRVLPDERSVVNRLVRRLTRLGLLVVCAAGNRGGAEPVPPASSPEALTVGGLDDRNSRDLRRWRWWGSNHGPTIDGHHKPDLLAPAAWVPAPVLPGTEVAQEAACLERLGELSDLALMDLASASDAPKRVAGRSPERIRRGLRLRRRRLKLVDAHHQHVEGTSFAAPIVSSCAAQLLEVDPRLGPAEVKEVLMATALPLDGVSSEQQGAGVLRPRAAVAFARRRRAWPTDLPSPEVTGSRVRFHLLQPGAQRVELVADWNGWQPGHTPLKRVADGVWTVTAFLPPAGHHRYAFLVDGQLLCHDPENPRSEPDGLGGWRSVLRVPRG